ncbi:MAG: hypothetical protein ACE5H0_00150 [Bacteroidota bacterium]
MSKTNRAYGADELRYLKIRYKVLGFKEKTHKFNTSCSALLGMILTPSNLQVNALGWKVNSRRARFERDAGATSSNVGEQDKLLQVESIGCQFGLLREGELRLIR